MKLEEIIAVTGKPGLYKIISQSNNSVIVESLIDNKRFPISAMHNISVLDNIAIYTYEEEVPLKLVFKTIALKEEGKTTISHKESNAKLTSFFGEILPNYDDERVYPSNIKKVVQWYNLLAENNFDFSSITEDEATDEN